MLGYDFLSGTLKGCWAIAFRVFRNIQSRVAFFPHITISGRSWATSHGLRHKAHTFCDSSFLDCLLVILVLAFEFVATSVMGKVVARCPSSWQVGFLLFRKSVQFVELNWVFALWKSLGVNANFLKALLVDCVGNYVYLLLSPPLLSLPCYILVSPHIQSMELHACIGLRSFLLPNLVAISLSLFHFSSLKHLSVTSAYWKCNFPSLCFCPAMLP